MGRRGGARERTPQVFYRESRRHGQVGLRQTKGLELLVESLAGDAQGACGGALVLVVVPQGFEENEPFDVVHHLLEGSFGRLHFGDQAVNLSDAMGKNLRRDEPAVVGFQNETLHFVLELAHVAGPFESCHLPHYLIAYFYIFMVLAVKAVKKIRHQRDYIVRPLSQWGDIYRNHT